MSIISEVDTTVRDTHGPLDKSPTGVIETKEKYKYLGLYQEKKERTQKFTRYFTKFQYKIGDKKVKTSSSLSSS